MDHVHSEEAQAYYLDQLCTIALCGALAGVGIMMWFQDMLLILAAQFRLLVLAGSLAVLALVVIRAVALWKAVGQVSGHHQHGPGTGAHHHHHGHDHDHHHHDRDPDGGHDHNHADPASPPPAAVTHHHHDHDHEHGWSPWRYAVLLLPISLCMLGLPNKEFSPENIAVRLPKVELVDPAQWEMPERGSVVIPLEFPELRQAAFLPAQRSFYEGKMGKIMGQFLPQDDTTCKLVRVKMVCCAADATPISVLVKALGKLPELKPMQWVEVEGQIQFHQRKDRNEYVPVLLIKTGAKVVPVDGPKNPYI